MCRNIRVLFNFQPPTTHDEIRAAAIQYVRKVGGITKVPAADQAAFDEAVDEVAASTAKLLAALHPKGAPRTRESEREKAKVKWARREARFKSA